MDITVLNLADKVPRVSSLEIAHFKEAVGRYATGVVVVSAQSNVGPVGFTCQTFGSLSLDPILISFAANANGHSWPLVREATTVGINILSAQQESLARVFATTGIDKFESVGWEPGPNGTPLLEGAIAHLEGQILSYSTHGDHDIAVVRIDHVASHPGEPLIYFRGGFDVLD
jgi:3-hydroxy-9,10-secoandrosta-1,3,5(10)-triene-9,17-dione monooxygenase reductase component